MCKHELYRIDFFGLLLSTYLNNTSVIYDNCFYRHLLSVIFWSKLLIEEILFKR